MKRLLTILLYLGSTFIAWGQDSIRHRIILIGNAGETDLKRPQLLDHAAGNILAGKTTVLFLGDNAYPSGIGQPGTREGIRSEIILKQQYAAMRAGGAPVYLIPGNRDWDNSGIQGLEKVKREWSMLNAQGDSLLQLVPANGCADPVEIPVSDSLVIIAYDSEWWLFPYDTRNTGAGCSCNSRRDVTAALQALFYKNRYKIILLASHHPFQSYGTHGGYHSWKEHLFPFTAVNPQLYIPLPVIGSLYPLLRNTFAGPEDLNNPLYKEMVRNVEEVSGRFPNLVHVSGHEHGMQLIQEEGGGHMQVITGGGSDKVYTVKGKKALFGVTTPGYVTADLLKGNAVRFTFYGPDDSGMHAVYSYVWQSQRYQDIETAAYAAIPGDSITIAAHAVYNNAGWLHRVFFGRNYRSQWARPVRLPVIRLSEISGGLHPVKLGGGFQSTSLRLENADGKEYALRTVEKKPDLIVPRPFQGTFVREILDDATSAQHPYSALIVPTVADAAHVPHANPVIGVVAPDSSLGTYQTLFDGKVALLEEREPLGKSDNFGKMFQHLQEDNSNSYDALTFLRARTLDVLFADWDRHADQWRFYNQSQPGSSRYYIAVPRDRDMVLNATQGILPALLKRLLVMPRVWGFNGNVMGGSSYYLFKSAFLNAHPASQITHAAWSRTVTDVQAAITDSVLQQAVARLPSAVYETDHPWLLADLKSRRNHLAAAMEKYYRFSNRVVDIQLSDKNEFVNVTDSKDSNALVITVRKISKTGSIKDTVMSKVYPAALTREIRLYTSDGNDSVVVNNTTSTVRLRLIGGRGEKAYLIAGSKKKVRIYDRPGAHYYGNVSGYHTSVSDDSMHTAFVATSLYNTATPLINLGVNPDDGFLLGAGVRYMQQRGFRKTPYTALHQLMVTHAFATEAFGVRYTGEWTDVWGKADLLLNVAVKAPDNTQNFFGRGNETEFNKTGDYMRYYRTRFDLIEVQPAIRWKNEHGGTISAGPAFQYYHLNGDDNAGRFIMNTAAINSYDSATLDKNRAHAGVLVNYTLDKRNNPVLPSWGTYVNVQVSGYAGLNSYSKSYGQLQPSVAVYKSMNARQTVVLADRIGGGITAGKTAFYQSLFLGGQGNLLGFRQYRFAGQHSVYNNLELRVVLSDFGNYIIRGQIGLTGFYDIGRVWQSDDHSGKWHNGVGGGVYVAPANLAVFKIMLAHSEEGLYPFLAMGVRF